LICFRQFENGQWFAARTEFACGNGAGFDATVFADSEGSIHFQKGFHFCGHDALKFELEQPWITNLARLKMNVLHLHLTDNEMNSLRFKRLPLGKENPAAISLGELKELVKYARRYHVAILPEIECWGHAKSLVYHRPDLCGKMYEARDGANFGVGRELIVFLSSVLEPWRYFERHEERLVEKLKKYAGRGKPRFMMGAGMSPGYYGGHFGATRLWCRNARGIPNVEGVTICLWEDNDLPGKFLGVYGGAAYARSPENPAPPEPVESDRFWERFYYETGTKMRRWQVMFKDADDEAMRADRGAYVSRGRYFWGKRAGKPVSPTVPWTGPGN
jgi:hypothetical protein